MEKYNTMNLYQFQKQFSTEEFCENHLFHLKWPNGYVCEKCGHRHHYVTKTRKLTIYECKECRYQSTVTVGTIFEKTRTPLTKWFLAIFLIGHDKRGISTSMLSKEISVAYTTAWLMLHKIRYAMATRDQNYNLSGIIELDDAYFGAPTEGGKRGRGTEQTKVLIGLSLNKKGHPLYLKMEIINDIKGTTITDFAKRLIKPNSTIHSDGYKSYFSLTKEGYKLENHVFDPKGNPDHLNWLHKIVSNAKAFIAGTFHGLDSKHLQAYLNEFTYRFNRRKFKGEWFSRLLTCCVSTQTITYSELIV